MNSEPAFPTVNKVVENGRVYEQHAGMTLRDYFAAHAMISIAAQRGNRYAVNDKDEFAVDAYKVADAMLAERERKSDQ